MSWRDLSPQILFGMRVLLRRRFFIKHFLSHLREKTLSGNMIDQAQLLP